MMEKLVLNLPLQEIIIRQVVIRLWSVDESFDLFLLQKFRLSVDEFGDLELPYLPGVQFRGIWLTSSQSAVTRSQEWREALEKVKVKIMKLGVPASLEKKMMLVVKPIGLEMLIGKLVLIAEDLSDSRRDVDMQILKQLCWTNAGQIDYEKTAEKLVHLETLDVVKRFRFACLNFLVDRIPDLWEALPENYQKGFDYEGDYDSFHTIVTRHEFYWYRTLKNYQKAHHDMQFHFTATRANKAAIKYFFPKLSKEQRDSCLCSTVCEVVSGRFIYLSSILDFFPKESFSDLLFHLLSEMSREEVEQVIKVDPCHFLGCFLDWPFQDLLPDIADVVWPHIPESKYKCLYFIMDEHFASSGYYFPAVFQEFFVRSPAAFRKFFIEHDNTFISEFVKTKDAYTIVAMLRSFDVEERIELISYNLRTSSNMSDKLVMDDDCDFVRLCLLGALESAEVRERVRRTLLDGVAYWGFLSDKDSVMKMQRW